MLTRRTLLATSAAGLAAPAVIGSAHAATPKNVVVQAKSIDDIIGAFDPAESYEFSDNEVCGNMYRKLIVPDPADADKLVGDLAEKWEVSKDGLTFTFQIRKGVAVREWQAADRGRRGVQPATRGEAQQDARLHPDPVRLERRQRREDDHRQGRECRWS